MKKIFFAVVAVLLLGSCNNNTTEDKSNPYLPIADLVIPREGVAGENVTMQGRGFTDDCKVFVQLNGTTTRTATTLVSADNSSLTFKLPKELAMGFYIVGLQRGEAYNKIGGINIQGNSYEDSDFELYALAGKQQEIYPVSVTKQMKGTAFEGSSTAMGDSYFGGVVALPDGMFFYTGFFTNTLGKIAHIMGSYDMNSHVNSKAEEIPGLYSIGSIDGVLHMLKTTDNATYTLYKQVGETQTPVQTFDFGAFGSLRLLEYDYVFEYHEPSKTIMLAGVYGVGTDISKAAFSLNVETGAVAAVGNNGEYKCWFAVEEEKLYCFVTKVVEGSPQSTKALLIDNPAQWSIGGAGATQLAEISNTGFEGPIYSPKTGMIYAFDDIEDCSAILSFNTATGRFESKKWINPGLSRLFYIDPITAD